MRLLLITHSLATGGTDRVAVHLANGLAQSCETTLLTVRKPGLATGLIEMIDPSVELISLDRSATSRAVDLVMGVPAMVRHIRRLQPDLIIATGNNNSLFSMIGHLSNPNPLRKFVVKITNPVLRAKDGRFKRTFRSALYRLVLGRCSRILVLSAGEGRSLASLYPGLADRIRVTQNPYVTPQMLAAFSRREPTGPERRFLMIGRLHAQKNIPLLLEAWAIARPPNARLQIAGDGPLRDNLVAQADRLGIAPVVDFLGYRTDVAALLGATHCMILSSDYEGLPAVVLEAFAAGCPVISTDCFPAAAELVGTAPGCVVVPCRDAAALAAAIGTVAARRGAADVRLQQLALPYTIANAIANHLAVLQL